jgi:hypothetical protein
MYSDPLWTVQALA